MEIFLKANSDQDLERIVRYNIGKAYQLRNIKNYLDGYNSITNLIQECLLDEDNWTDKTSMESIKALLNNFNTEVGNIKIEFNRQALNTFSNI